MPTGEQAVIVPRVTRSPKKKMSLQQRLLKRAMRFKSERRTIRGVTVNSIDLRDSAKEFHATMREFREERSSENAETPVKDQQQPRPDADTQDVQNE